MSDYRRLEDLVVYRKLCQLHIEVCALTHRWPEKGQETGAESQGLAFRIQEAPTEYHADTPPGYPESPDPEPLNPEPRTLNPEP